MGLISEFKAFAMRGNVVGMAVGVVMGGAFGKIVSSFTNDVLMPPIGLAMGGIDFSDLKVDLQQATETAKRFPSTTGSSSTASTSWRRREI